MSTQQRVLVTGATGYIGGRLVPELLAAGHRVRALARDPRKLQDQTWVDDVEVVQGDVTDGDSLVEAMEGVSAAYYLVHSMGGSTSFADSDREAAATFRDAAAEAGVSRMVYLGGLGRDDDATLSPHLASRHEVGRVLADGPVPVVELRAAIIIGSGSASFEMLRSLVEVLPLMVTPRWVRNRCQPIAIRDVLAYLVDVLDIDPREDTASGAPRVLEIGGPDVLTYREMMQTYAQVAGLAHRGILAVPVLTPRLSSHWVGLVTPLPTGLAKPLVEGLANEVVVTQNPIGPVVPRETLQFRTAIELALRRVAEQHVATRWTDAEGTRSPADPAPSDPSWAGGLVLTDTREAYADAAPDEVFDVIEGIGGRHGWYVTRPLWEVRGVVDKLVGGIGMRRGRRDADRLRVGDALDFWRVEAVEPGRLIRLRAEMKLPGYAWLEWELRADGKGTRIEQRTEFHPRGMGGRLYWYAQLPFHIAVFRYLLAAIAADAESDAMPHNRIRADEPTPT